MPELAQLELLEPTTLPERVISKSKFISGMQCAKLIWHQYNAKELIPPYDASHQAVFDQGHKVGRRAPHHHSRPLQFLRTGLTEAWHILQRVPTPVRLR